MKPFVFRLERLLELRRGKEQTARRELAVAQRAVQAQDLVLLKLMTEEAAAKTELRSLQTRAVDVGRVSRVGEFLGALARRILREREAAQGLARIELEKRKGLVEAQKGVRILERYRERKFRLHRLELDRGERNFLDEVGQNLSKGA